jgi:type IV pilus modification protein PilV
VEQLMVVFSSSAKRARSGFTLLEVLFAFVILGIGLLAVAAMQLHAMQFGRAGRHQTEAAVVARNRLELLQRLPWASVAPTGGWTVPVAVANVVQAPTDQTEITFSRRERITDLVAGRTRTIDVQVQWNEPDRPNRVFTLSTIRVN